MFDDEIRNITHIQVLSSIRLALRSPKYICSKLLHDSSGLPYVKDRFLSCSSKSLDRIAQNPLAEEAISSNRLNPAWDCFPIPLSVVSPVSFLLNTIYLCDISKRLSLSETVVVVVYLFTYITFKYRHTDN